MRGPQNRMRGEGGGVQVRPGGLRRLVLTNCSTAETIEEHKAWCVILRRDRVAPAYVARLDRAPEKARP